MYVSNKFQKKLLAIQTESGGVYIGHDINRYLAEQIIDHQLSTPYSPKQNGNTERKNQSLTEMYRCMLLEADIPEKYWGEAINRATCLQNRLLTKGAKSTPCEQNLEWFAPRMKHLRVFGSKALPTFPKKSGPSWI